MSVFKKPFSFRKKRKQDDEDGNIDSKLVLDRPFTISSNTTSLSPVTPSQPVAALREPSSSPSPSPGAHPYDTNSIDAQFTRPELGLRHSSGSGVDRNDDPSGLRVVHRPLGERHVDIIFVHGLGGSSRRTWSKNRDLDYFWPLKFLPLEQDISEARISTFGYNANFHRGSAKTKVSVLDFAKDLLYDLKYAQDDSKPENGELGMGERPIIFIVHSMGGLVVKQAYMQGQNDPEYERVIKSVSSIIFLSTPHRGTNLADALNRILQVSFVSNPTRFIAELSPGSQTIQTLNEQFRHAAPKLQIVSFYETRPTTMLKNAIMVLEKESSVLGYPGEISKALDADHHTICKYDSRDDPRYISVRNVLKSLVGKVRPKAAQVDRTTRPVEKRVNLEEYLQVPSTPVEDYNFFRDRWTVDTCDWILNNDAFNSWKDDETSNPRILWLHGNAASGKSVVSSYIINHLIQLDLPCHYFFIRFSSQKKRSLSMLLRSLACQFAHSTPEYAETLYRLAEANTDLKSADFRNIWQYLYKQGLLQVKLDRPSYVVLDGVDEAEAPGAIIRLLSDLQSAAIPLRIVLVSRKTHEISSAFQRLGRQVLVESIRTEGNHDDFRSYIDQEMDIADSYKEHVTKQLLDRSRGNFLWVHLAVQKINACYTRKSVEDALSELPPGMEALYDRMATAVQNQANETDGNLGRRILEWATCAQRLLSVEELGDALGGGEDILEIQRTIVDLCGGFVVVDKEGMVSMIHETAREYLTRSGTNDMSFRIDLKTTNNILFQSCLQRLEDPKLPMKLNRNQPPALLDYAISSWFIHYSCGSSTSAESSGRVVKFLKSTHVLTWMYVAARRQLLKVLVVASRYLADVVMKLREDAVNADSLKHQQNITVIESWATDLVKIVGKFGNNLLQNPDSIQKLIAPFCPQDSIMYQQFGKKETRALQVTGLTSNSWDDCLARISLEPGFVASAILPVGNRIAILSNIRASSRIMIYYSTTFEEYRVLIHPERVSRIQGNKLGTLLLTYGYLTTRVWDLATGECIKIVANPPKKPRPQSINFIDTESIVLVAGEDRVFRWFSLLEDSPQWVEKVKIEEEVPENTIINFPTCAAINPDGNLVAFGYRQHPVTVWDLETDKLLGQGNFGLGGSDMTGQAVIFGEVASVAWHPFNSEVFGITYTGGLFKWDYREEEASKKFNALADQFTISRDGSLVATGDGVGTVKVFAAPDLALLYQLSSQDPVLHISFSADSRRLYDVRGSYANIWEPNTLVRLADNSEYPDHSSDAVSETEGLTKLSLRTEHQFATLDNVIALAGQSVGPLYCYGTEDGVAVLGEVGSGTLCELERLTSYMSIEQVAWSEDGRLLALSDLSGKVSLKRITRTADRFTCSDEFDLLIPTSKGHISHLIFSPVGGELFASTPKALFTINLVNHQLKERVLSPSIGQLKWIIHPTVPDYLLGFGVSSVSIFTWRELEEVATISYDPPRTTDTGDEAGQTHGNFRKDNEKLGRIVSRADSPRILLTVLTLTASGLFEYHYLVFAVKDIDVKTTGHEQLPYTTLPAELAARIYEPLAFLSRDRLLFLDMDRWICGWQFTSRSSQRPTQRSTSESSIGPVEQYYFLPGDWATANEAELCTIMPDGTLLCPRNGEVATVQFTKIRK